MAGISKLDRRMFAAARRAAQKSDFDNFHVGCVVVYKKHIIGIASNSDKTHPAQAKYNQYRKFNRTKNGIKHSVHAEIAAIHSVPYVVGRDVDWSKVKIYIYRICPGKVGGYGLGRPCLGCMQAIKDIGIHHIYYTGEGSYIYERLL